MAETMVYGPLEPILYPIIKAAGIFCKFGGPYVGPFIIPIVGLFSLTPVSSSLSSSLIFMMAFLMTLPITKLDGGDGTTKKHSLRYGIAAILYYIFAVIIWFFLLRVACKVQKFAEHPVSQSTQSIMQSF